MAKKNNIFEKLFLKREFDALAGKKYRTITLLCTILTLTFLALGAAVGGLNELRQKMSNPFTNWVNLPVSMSNTSNAMHIMNDFKERKLLDKFLLDTIRPYRERYPQFVHPFGNKSVNNYKIRSINPEDKILTDAILLPDNIVHQKIKIDDRNFDCGIIITQDFYNLTGDQAKSIDKVAILQEDAQYRDTSIYYVDVIAVVKELPNNCAGVMPENLFRLMGPGGSQLGFINLEMLREIPFIIDTLDDDVIETLKHHIKKIDASMNVIEVDQQPHIANGIAKKICTLYFEESYSYDQRKSIVTKLKKSSSLNIDYYDPYECHVKEGQLTIDIPQYLALNFASSTKEIRSLKDFVKKKYNLELTMDQVEDKENFYLVSRITSLLGFLLGVFSLISIILFIYNLIQSHFDKVKSSLGTLSAYGLDIYFLQSAYIKIISSFMLISTVISLIISTIFMIVINYGHWLGLHIDIWNAWILFVIFLMMSLVISISYYFIKKSLNKSPGDLIYNR
jgi:hypothetical protein